MGGSRIRHRSWFSHQRFNFPLPCAFAQCFSAVIHAKWLPKTLLGHGHGYPLHAFPGTIRTLCCLCECEIRTTKTSHVHVLVSPCIPGPWKLFSTISKCWEFTLSTTLVSSSRSDPCHSLRLSLKIPLRSLSIHPNGLLVPQMTPSQISERLKFLYQRRKFYD